jgi:hypothetical protein
MIKDESIREQMFASVASWLSSELSQKQRCQDLRAFKTELLEEMRPSSLPRLLRNGKNG